MTKKLHHLALLALWLIIILIVNPVGEFPINDDWSLAFLAKHFGETGSFLFSDDSTFTVLTHTVWGGIFVKIFGFSFLALRVSTLLLGIATTALFVEIMRNQGVSRSVATMMAVALLCSPIFLNQSFTFMTEIPFLCLGGLSLLFYAKFFNRGRGKHLFYAVVFTCLMLLIRQTALIIPAAFMLTYLLYRIPSWKSILSATLPLLVGVVLLVWYENWRSSFGDGMGNYYRFNDFISKGDLYEATQRLGTIFHYVGFALIPVGTISISKLKRRLITPTRWILFVVSSLIVIIAMFQSWSYFPTGNVFENFAIGPKSTTNMDLGDVHGSKLSETFWFFLRSLNLVSMILALYLTFGVRNDKKLSYKVGTRLMHFICSNPFLIMVMVLVLGQLVYLLVHPTFTDRFSIPLFAVVLVMFGLIIKKMTRVAFISGIVVMTGVLTTSILLVRDQMSWNRARAKAIKHATQVLEIDPIDIDSGEEINRWNREMEKGGLNEPQYSYICLLYTSPSPRDA